MTSFSCSLTLPGSGAKKIKGCLHYFGVWSKPQAALDSYKAFIGGEVDVELTIKQLINHFLTSKTQPVVSGELKKLDNARLAFALPLSRGREIGPPEAKDAVEAYWGR